MHVSFRSPFLPRILVAGADRPRRAIATHMALASVVAVIACLAVPTPDGVARALATTGAWYVPLFALSRVLFRALPRISGRSKRALLVGTNDLALAVAQELADRPRMGFDVAGFLGVRSEPDRLESEYGDLLGQVSEVKKVAVDCDISAILVAEGDGTEGFSWDTLFFEKLRGVHVESAETFYERVTGRLYLPALSVRDLLFSPGFRESRPAKVLRRAIDLLGASSALVLAAPWLLVASVAIKLDSPGPVLSRQVRVGKEGKHFALLKLRSMTNRAAPDTGSVRANRKPPRVTRVGRALRATRLDEVPQFWNVLVGDMSFVGPRPARPEVLELLTERLPLFRFRSAVKPGLTGWAQVHFVDEIEAFEQTLALDLFYLKHRSIALDLRVFGKTIQTVLGWRGFPGGGKAKAGGPR